MTDRHDPEADRERADDQGRNGDENDGDEAPPRRFDYGPDYAADLDLTKEPDYLYNTQPFYSGEADSVSGPPDAMQPGSYRRTDEGLRAAVGNRLAAQGDLDHTHIEVEVAGGRVTLRGYVPDARSKHLAEEVAGIVAGVTGIDNELQLTHEQGAARR